MDTPLYRRIAENAEYQTSNGRADGVDTEWLRCPSSLYLQVVSPVANNTFQSTAPDQEHAEEYTYAEKYDWRNN